MARQANLKWKIEVNTTGVTYKEIKGIESISWDSAEEVQEGYFLSDGGFGYSDVTAGRLNITLSGKRIDPDDGQDYIIGKVGKWGADLKTNLKLTNLGTSDVYTIPCSIEVTTPFGGDAEGLEEFEVVFHSDGAWSVA